MPNRKRWYAELAGTILLWVEEEPDNPPFPWRGFILRRPQKAVFEGPGGPVKLTLQHKGDSFLDKSEKSAMENAERSVRNDRASHDYAHRLGELKWREWELSEEEWEKQSKRFYAEGRME